VYVPGWTVVNVNRPSALLTTVREFPIWSLMRVTDAPAINPPFESVTVPETVPVVCPNTVRARIGTTNKAQMILITNELNVDIEILLTIRKVLLKGANKGRFGARIGFSRITAARRRRFHID